MFSLLLICNIHVLFHPFTKLVYIFIAESEPIAEPFVLESMKRADAFEADHRSPNVVGSNDINIRYRDPPRDDPTPIVEDKPEGSQGTNVIHHNRIPSTQPTNNTPTSLESSLPPQLANLLQTLQAQDLPEEQPQTDTKLFYKVRTILCVLIGVLVRLSFFCDIGPTYVQVCSQFSKNNKDVFIRKYYD